MRHCVLQLPGARQQRAEINADIDKAEKDIPTLFT